MSIRLLASMRSCWAVLTALAVLGPGAFAQGLPRFVNGEALVSVADLGIGIAADELPRLFQRFYRTRETGSTEGLGLGLYITRKLVEAHGGRIWAESPGPGQGATFYFTLPVTRANRRPAIKESGQRTGGAPCARSV